VDLLDRSFLVTGVRRIGAAVAVELARRGAHVAVAYHQSASQAEGLASRIGALGRRSLALQGDLSRVSECRRVVNATAASLGRLDGLVCLASRYERVPVDDVDVLRWDAALDLDLRATWACVSAALPHLRAMGGGRIVTCADWIAASGRPRYLGYLPYYVAKAGVIALTEALALELARDGILVNCVAPGPIVPPAGTPHAVIQANAQAIPLGRWGGEDAIAKAVVALMASDFVTGETIRVDGGRHLR
jgi:NAD(P)-dependent dehydrogenase (short-subunit alcohol dehydrogenase family)